MKTWSKRWTYLALGFLSLSTIVSLSLPYGYALTTFGDISQTLLLFGCYLSTLPNQSSTRGRATAFWTLMGVGFAFWLIAQGLWACFEVILHKHVPDPFVGDIILFMHVVPMLSALALQPHKTSERTVGVGLANAALMFVWFLSMYLYYVIPWQYVNPDKAIYDTAFDRMYVFANLTFVTTAGALWLQSTGAWKRLYTHLFAAGAIYSVGSYMASQAINIDSYYTGSLYDVVLAGSMLWFISAGLIAHDMSEELQPAPATQATSTGPNWETWLSVGASISIALLGTWGSFADGAPVEVRNFRLLITMIATVTLGLLVLMKQHLLRKARRCELSVSPSPAH